MNEIKRKERQKLLKKIIKEKNIHDQTQLMNELEKYNIKTTQASVSRDLQELEVVKVRVESGKFKYEILEKVSKGLNWKRLIVLFENFVTDIKSTNNLILIKTVPGNANGVAIFVDNLERPEILGTVAGDDTILVVVDTVKNREKVEREFREIQSKILTQE